MGRLLPLVKASATNRFLMNRMGDRGFKAVARYWMRDQERSGDGLRFMRRIYEPGLLRRMIWPVARLAMLRRGHLQMGVGISVCHSKGSEERCMGAQQGGLSGI